MTAAFNIALPAAEPKAVIIGFRDEAKLDPIWAIRPMIRIREGNGWIEIPADIHSRKDNADEHRSR